jgi:cobalt/nickel transport system permease protein
VTAGHLGGGHLLVARDSPLHRLGAAAKVVGAIALAGAVVAVPRGTWVPLAAAAAVVAGMVWLARLPVRTVAARTALEAPFIGFALLMPLFGSGPQVEVLGVALYRSGIEAGATLLTKATLGVVVAVVLAATTPTDEVLGALRRLRVPAALVAIMGQLVRYGEVLVTEAKRMHVARLARAENPRWLWQARGFASGLGMLFIRSVERGERVQRAMVARGFTGSIPRPPPTAVPAGHTALALVPAAIVIVTMAAVW